MPSLVTECCDLLIDDGGFTATERTISSQLKMPPNMPPAGFDSFACELRPTH